MRRELNKKGKVCIVTSPRPKASIAPLSHLCKIISSLCSQTFLITGNEGNLVFKTYKMHGHCITDKPKSNLVNKIFSYIFLQIRISYELVKLSNKVNLYIFFMGESLLLPVSVLKVLRKNVILALASSTPKIVDSKKNPPYIHKILKYLELRSYSICDNIILYSPNLLHEWSLEKYKQKVFFAHEHFLDFNSFKSNKKLDERFFSVGYIGRLSNEKGVFNFVKAIPELLQKKPCLKFFICGEGELQKAIETHVSTKKINNTVTFARWIPHEKISDTLNEIKLIVIPSYTEGIPNILLESMACGAVVLATPVGAIPDIIEDGINGFIMKDNSPECIETNILRVLNHEDLNVIVKNAQVFVENSFNFKNAVSGYKKIIDPIIT